MMLKCTSWNILDEHKVEWRIRDCDDNPTVLPDHFETIDIHSIDGTMKTFTNCILERQGSDFIDEQYLVHPYIYRFESVS